MFIIVKAQSQDGIRTEPQFSSVQDGIYALGKAHMRSLPSFRSVLNVAKILFIYLFFRQKRLSVWTTTFDERERKAEAEPDQGPSNCSLTSGLTRPNRLIALR